MGRTAARLHRLDGAEHHSIIEIAVSFGRHPTPQRVIIRRTRRPDASGVTSIRGIPVSSVNQTLLDYASFVPPIVTERAVEDAILRGRTGEGALRRVLAGAGRGVPGVTALRGVLDGRPDGRPARSGFEVIVLDILREYGLPLPVRRPLVAVPPDRKFELDLAYLDRLVDIEPMGAALAQHGPPASPRRRAPRDPRVVRLASRARLLARGHRHAVSRRPPRRGRLPRRFCVEMRAWRPATRHRTMRDGV